MSEIEQLAQKMGETFEEFKRTNDERIEKLAKQEAVSDLDEKIAKMNDDLSKLDELKCEVEALAKKAALGSGFGEADDPVKEEHRKAYSQFLRRGQDAGLADLQEKAVQVGVDADGGYAVPEELDRMIADLEQEAVAMRRLATVMQVSNEEYKKLVNIGGAASGWVGETDDRPETAGPKLAAIAPSFGEVYANPAATQKSLDDIFFDVEQWIASEVAREFEEREEAAFIAGDGTDKPKGLLAYTTAATNDAARAFGTLQHVNSGAATAVTGDGLLDLVYATKAGYRSRGKFLMNSLTVAEVRKLKDGNGDYLWRPGLEAGQPSTLLGYQIEESEQMPDLAADSLSVAFGDFARAYLIVDVRGTRVLRDPFTNKPYVHFYTTKRMGGALVDSNAVKLLKTSA